MTTMLYLEFKVMKITCRYIVGGECAPAKVSEYPKRDLTTETLIIYFPPPCAQYTTFLSDGVDGSRGGGSAGWNVWFTHQHVPHAGTLYILPFFLHSLCIVNRLQDKTKNLKTEI